MMTSHRCRISNLDDTFICISRDRKVIRNMAVPYDAKYGIATCCSHNGQILDNSSPLRSLFSRSCHTIIKLWKTKYGIDSENLVHSPPSGTAAESSVGEELHLQLGLAVSMTVQNFSYSKSLWVFCYL